MPRPICTNRDMKPIRRHLAASCLLLAMATAVAAGDNGRKCKPLLDPGRAGKNSLAVTLAGGGTKASSFGMGVLSALASEKFEASGLPERASKLALWQTDIISTVSGGSYAGYFLYSRLLNPPPSAPGSSPTTRAELVRSYFADCIPANLETQFASLPQIADAEAKRRGTTADRLFCASYANAIGDAGTEKLQVAQDFWNRRRPETLHQQFLRCHQDVLTWQLCDFGVTGSQEAADQGRNLGTGAALALVTTASLPAAWIANFLFDWPLNVSPSRVAYRDGIGMAFGLRPLDARAIQGTTEWAFNVNAIAGAKLASGQLVPDPANLDFTRLKALTGGNPTDPPRWVINATAAPSRHLLGWLSQNDIDFDRHIFRMAGDEQCAESVGPIPVGPRSLWDASEPDANLSPLLTAVNASAAFFDSNERALGQPLRFVAGVGLLASNMDWGIDLINIDPDNQRRTSWAREKLHEVTPFPLYLAESASAHASGHDPVFVRLLDGGSTDNLGAYGPIVEGVRDIIISDHSQDTRGNMQDLCYLHNELFLRRGLYLHIPGLAGWPDGCLAGNSDHDPQTGRAERLQQLKASGKSAIQPDIFYPIWAWPYPFLAGCVSRDSNPASCLGEPSSRLWIIKPAFDYPYWLRQQTRCLNPPAGDPACTGLPAGQQANRAITACGASDELPCESSAVLLRHNRYLERTSIFATPEFPQGSTVQMTFNSSANVYGAYRELAHHYTRQALRAVDRARAEPAGASFGNILCWQGTHPIRGTPDPRDLEFLPAWTDIRLAGWGNRERDAARRGVGKGDSDAYGEAVQDCASRLAATSGKPKSD
jgi:hypothetical protein